MAFGSSLNGDTLPMLASMFAYLTGLKCDCRQALSDDLFITRHQGAVKPSSIEIEKLKTRSDDVVDVERVRCSTQAVFTYIAGA